MKLVFSLRKIKTIAKTGLLYRRHALRTLTEADQNTLNGRRTQLTQV